MILCAGSVAASSAASGAWPGRVLLVRRLVQLGASLRAPGRLQVTACAHQRHAAAASSSLAPAAAPAGGASARAPPPQPEQQHLEQQQEQHSAAAAGLEPHHPHHGIELVLGPMFAGKSTELLRRVALYEAEGLSVAVVKSSKDDRYCAAHVVTHNGLKRPCFAAPTLAAFREAAGAAYGGFQVIAVDEAQFFPDLHAFCSHAADHEHKRLVLAGLDGDFRRQRFGQVLDLLPMADSVTKLTSWCKFCTQEQRRVPAVFSLRISADSRQEVVGGADVYAPVCRQHYVQLAAVRGGLPDGSSDGSGGESASEEDEATA